MGSELEDTKIRVAEVIDKRTVVLNVGENYGVSKGDKFVVFEMGEEVEDPETGDSLGKLEIVKGKGKVIHVQPKMCHIQTYDYETKKVKKETGVGGVIAQQISPPKEEEVKEYEVFDGVEVGDHARPQ